MKNITEIEHIRFGILSPDDILKLSVCKISTNKMIGCGSVYDQRMGVLDPYDTCQTCKQGFKDCPGHFGHIELFEPVIHPCYYKLVKEFLTCICFYCHRPLLSKEQLKLNGLIKYKSENRFEKIVKYIKKIDICFYCEKEQPEFVYSKSDNQIQAHYKSKKRKNQPGIKFNKTTKITIETDEIKQIFDDVSDDDIKILGMDPSLTHPKNLILTILPVLPPCARPYITSPNNNITCDDDITLKYIDIYKINEQLRKVDTNDDIKRTKLLRALRFHIRTLIDNQDGKSTRNNKSSTKSIKERIVGRDGIIRNNIMGKRTEQSGRTVIGPDPTLRLGEIAVPKEMTQTLTIPIRVCDYNKSYLNHLITSNKANFVLRTMVENGTKKEVRFNLKYSAFAKGTELLFGDVVFRGEMRFEIKNIRNFKLIPGDKIKRNGKFLEGVVYPHHKTFNLRNGDIVERQLFDGDIVLLNRQPTLHKGSMLAHRIRIIGDGKTIRLPLPPTKTYNADFDGDEMNIHVPQSPEAQIELELLSHIWQNLISVQDCKSNIAIVQDSLLGVYLMTKSEERIPKHTFFQIYMKSDISFSYYFQRLKQIKNVRKEKRIRGSIYNGKTLFSLILPSTFNFECKDVLIYKGVLLQGAITKQLVGSSHTSLIHMLLKEYDVKTSVSFVDNLQFIVNEWLLYNGFSIGIEDCIATKKREIEDILTKQYVQAKGISETTYNPLICETKVKITLSNAKDIGFRIAREAFKPDNNFIATVMSGSKGDFFNIAQITGLLGQQNLFGNRIPLQLNNGRRSLPHYRFKNLTLEEEFESRGFISHSFIHGLNPKEFFFHTMTGREGVTDTAMKTSVTGYGQRKMTKCLEDLVVKYDGTVRTAKENIVQLSYGENGLDASHIMIENGDIQICNIERLANRLNIEYEEKIKEDCSI